jgi:uncharacterized membrane protein YdjX (TVP38/TMEM64 family)
MSDTLARSLGWKGTASRVAAIVLIAGGALALYAERGLVEPEAMLALLSQHEWAPFAFLLAHVAASLLFVPRTVMAITGGLLFGLWWGTALTMIGSMLGAAAGFAVGRYLHAGLRNFQPGRRARGLLQRLERGGWRTVMLFRLVPIMPHTPVNYAFGATRVGWGAYLGGSLLGLLPTTLVAVSVGATGGEAIGGTANWLEPMLIGLGALAVSLLLSRLIRRRDDEPRNLPDPG